MLADIEAALNELPYIWEALATLVVWVVALVFIRYNKRLFSRLSDELASERVEDRSIKALDQMLDLVTIVVAVFVTLYIWGIDEMIYAALTTVGIIGVMLAFAVRDIASNFISGILLILTKDILIGDAIEVNGIEGTVEKITVRTTTVRKYDGAVVLVPNSMIINNPVVDYSATPMRRVEVQVVMASEQDIQAASEALMEVGESEPRRLEGEEVAVLVKGFEAHAVTLELRFWVERAELLDVRSDIHGSIQRAFRERGLSLDIATTVSIAGDGSSALGEPSGNV